MKHKKKMHKAIQRRFDGYLYRSMTDESPMKGTIIFPINNDRRYVYFIKRNGDMKDALKVEYEEGRVSYSGMVWYGFIVGPLKGNFRWHIPSATKESDLLRMDHYQHVLQVMTMDLGLFETMRD